MINDVAELINKWFHGWSTSDFTVDQQVISRCFSHAGLHQLHKHICMQLTKVYCMWQKRSDWFCCVIVHNLFTYTRRLLTEDINLDWCSEPMKLCMHCSVLSGSCTRASSNVSNPAPVTVHTLVKGTCCNRIRTMHSQLVCMLCNSTLATIAATQYHCTCTIIISRYDRSSNGNWWANSRGTNN